MGVVSVVENTNPSTSASHKEHSVVVEIERFYEGNVMDHHHQSLSICLSKYHIFRITHTLYYWKKSLLHI